MLLPKDYSDEKNLLNISMIVREQKDFSIMEQVESFLHQQGYHGKTATFCTLCLEELMIRIVKGNATVIDVRLFVSEGTLKFSIRDDGNPNNYLIFEPEDMADGAGIRIVRKIAQEANYAYMAGFNVLSVQM